MITIPSPNTDRSLLTIAQIRAAAGVLDSSQDASLTLLGDYVSAVITRACQIVTYREVPPTLRLEGVIETIRPKNREPGFSLSRGPVVEITSLIESGRALTENVDFELDGRTLYRISGEARIYWPFLPAFMGQPIVVTYSAGWAIVPADLVFAASRFIAAEIAKEERDPTLKMRRIEGVSEYQWWVNPPLDTFIPPEVMTVLIAGGYVNRWGWML